LYVADVLIHESCWKERYTDALECRFEFLQTEAVAWKEDRAALEHQARTLKRELDLALNSTDPPEWEKEKSTLVAKVSVLENGTEVQLQQMVTMWKKEKNELEQKLADSVRYLSAADASWGHRVSHLERDLALALAHRGGYPHALDEQTGGGVGGGGGGVGGGGGGAGSISPAKAGPNATEGQGATRRVGFIPGSTLLSASLTGTASPTAAAVATASGTSAAVNAMMDNTQRAEVEWMKLDVGKRGMLEMEDVMELSEWVWTSFRPGQEITAQELSAEASRLLSRCDENGTLHKDAFRQYYAGLNRRYQEEQENQRYRNPQDSLDTQEIPDDPCMHKDRIWPLHESETADSPALRIYRALKRETPGPGDDFISNVELRRFMISNAEWVKNEQRQRGVIDWESLFAAHASVQGRRPGGAEPVVYLNQVEFVRSYEATVLFNEADHDKSGKITVQDLTYYVRRHQGQLKKRVGSFFDFKSFWAGMMTFDANNDGAIDYPEFIRWYTYGSREDGKHFKDMILSEISEKLQVPEHHVGLDESIRAKKHFLENPNPEGVSYEEFIAAAGGKESPPPPTGGAHGRDGDPTPSPFAGVPFLDPTPAEGEGGGSETGEDREHVAYL